jgi:hypothetical protein
VKADPATAFPYERECKKCGTRYTTIPAAPSSMVRTAAYVSGAVLILGGVLASLLSMATIPVMGGRGFTSCSMLTLFLSLMLGFKILSTPGRVQELREKLFKEYQASAPLGAPPLVELSPPPEMESLSLLFGILSLVSPLFSSLLMTVLFGPAAVVCGVLALAQGHLKGLIGLVLGVVSLIVWGLVFVYFFKIVQLAN